MASSQDGGAATRPPWVRAWLAALLLILPSTFYLSELGRFPRLPHNDYYPTLGLFVTGEELDVSLSGLLVARSNEHRVTLPVLVYLANLKLFHGDNRTLSIFALVLMGLICVALFMLLPDDARASPLSHAPWLLLVAIFAFTPVATHCVVMGFSGSMWLLSSCFGVASIWLLSVRRVPLAVLSALLGSFTYSTSASLWPALLLGAVLMGIDWRRCLMVAAGAAVAAWLFLSFYTTPSYHPEPVTLDQGGTLLGYLAVYLGGLFSADVGRAAAMGAVGLALAVVAAVWSMIRRGLPGAAPWLMLQLFAFGNALGTAVGRGGYGSEQALQSRYATVSTLFWCGLVMSLVLPLWRHRRLRVLVWLLVPALAAPMYLRGASVLATYLGEADRQPIAELAVVHGVHDDEALERSISPAPQQVWAVRGFLAAAGHVPFDRSRARVGELLSEPRVGGAVVGVLGGLDGQVSLGAGCRYSGWAFHRSVPVSEVLIVDEAGSIVADVLIGRPRAGLAESLGPAAERAGWVAYGPRPCAAVSARVLVRLEGERRLAELGQRFDLAGRADRLALGSQVDFARLARPAAHIRGVMDGERSRATGGCRYWGWAWSAETAVEEVLLLDDDGIVSAEVVSGVERPGVAEQIDVRAAASGWVGYGKQPCDRTILRAYVRLSGDPTFYALPVPNEVRRVWRQRRQAWSESSP